MSIMKCISILIVTLVLVGILWSFFVDLLNPDTGSEDDRSPVYHLPKGKTGHNLNGENQDIFWFVQITDLHLSKFKDRRRGPDLMEFCEKQLSIIRPDIVITTGDLVDAKYPNFVSSTQFKEEWIEYKKILDVCEQYTTAKWLDIRGNHDAFDVPDLNHNNNYYRKMSKQGQYHPTSYSYIHQKEFGQYSFLGMDACPDPGPKRPFNFFGVLSMARINELSKLSEGTKGSNMTIWFGHYPTSLIVQDPPGIKQVMRNGIVYLCGHLHTLLGSVPNMYTRQKTGTLELELGDWRDNRMFRLLAIDNDIISFKDYHLHEWPVILITNPKHALYQSITHEPLELIKTSTHIRFLVFNDKDIQNIKVLIDDTDMGEVVHIEGPLYSVPWTSSLYMNNIHYIYIQVIDVEGKHGEIKQPFSLDGSRPEFRLVPRLILMLNISVVGKTLFGGLVFLLTLFITSLRQCSNIRHYFLDGGGLLYHYTNRWLYKLWLVSRTDFTYYCHIFFILYITFGPWFIGDLLNEHIGCVFVWGIFIKDSFIPGSDTYFYGLFQIITFNIPLLLISSHILDLRSRLQNRNVIQSSYHLRVAFILLLLFQITLSLREFPRAYGTKALVLGPVRTGSLIYSIFIYYYLHRIRVNDGRTQSCTNSYS